MRSGNGLSINIPAEICKDSHILKGDKLTISMHEQMMIIRLDEIVHTTKSLGWKVKRVSPTIEASDAPPNNPEKSEKDSNPS